MFVCFLLFLASGPANGITRHEPPFLCIGPCSSYASSDARCNEACVLRGLTKGGSCLLIDGPAKDPDCCCKNS
ncbi:hypothetical protein K1719_028768 [Acacia pycnantha]|nr:hypothetical protein K1719_028768 [Acacia pycnantha]